MTDEQKEEFGRGSRRVVRGMMAALKVSAVMLKLEDREKLEEAETDDDDQSECSCPTDPRYLWTSPCRGLGLLMTGCKSLEPLHPPCSHFNGSPALGRHL